MRISLLYPVADSQLQIHRSGNGHLGLAYLAAFLLQRGHQVRVLDAKNSSLPTIRRPDASLRRHNVKRLTLLAIILLSSLPLLAQDGWIQLFNGKNLDGWRHVGPGSMTVENGLIQTHGGMGLLYWTSGPVGNCTLRVVFRMRDENDNSGVFIRIPIEPREEWMPVHYGYEVQIDNHPELSKEDDYHITGTLYSLTKPLAKPGKPGPQWNTMEITLDGPHTVVMLNGVKVTDYSEGDPVPAKQFDFEPWRGRRPWIGWFGLQNHSDNDIVFFKEVALKPLTK